MTTAGGNRSGVLRGRGVTRVMGVTGVTGQIAVGEETGEGKGNVTTTGQAKKQQGNIALFSQAMDAGRLR